MLRRRPALASVFLCFICLLALKPQRAAKLCSKDIVKQVQSLINKAPDLKWLDCRLYTPTITDYQQKCPRSTMKCFAKEIKVLIEEWALFSSFRHFKLISSLQEFADLLNQTESDCLQCELLKEEEAEKFLQDLRSTLQLMNYQHCLTHHALRGLSNNTQ